MRDPDFVAAMSVVAGRALLARAADALRAVSVVPVVLKGTALSALSEGWGDPPRAMLDVDVLVHPHERVAAERALAEAGLVRLARTSVATTFRAAELRVDLDVHERLVEPDLFALDPGALIARAVDASSLFGHPARVLERHDFYAHLVAHFARNRSNARDIRRLRDFGVLARALPMDADALAAHLEGAGLARASRYVLPLAARRGDAFAAAVLRALPRDEVGVWVARASEAWLARHAGHSPLAVPALHALNRSLPAGARSLARHLGRGAASRARRMLERAQLRG